MYDGWAHLVGPVVFSGIITLAAWILPQFRKKGTEVLNRQRKITIGPEAVHQGGIEVWFHR